MDNFYKLSESNFGKQRSLPFKLMAVLLFLIAQSFSSTAQVNKTVAKDGSGDYTTVQAAIDAYPVGITSSNPYRITIKNGVYKELISISSAKTNLQLIGESVGNVILTYDNYSGKALPGGGNYGTGNSASVTISATDFSAVNITFINSTGDAPQAVAVNVAADRAAFKNCLFLGGQDTLLPNGDGNRQYFLNCYIDGVVDFIFGSSRAVFDYCIIYPKDRADKLAGSYITAANTKAGQAYGYVFRNCTITENTGVTKYVLGRPWQNDAGTASKSNNKTVFLNSTMGTSVKTEGWSTWDSGTDVNLITYAEYKTKNFDGSLYDVSGRVSWSKQLNDTEAADYNDTNLFGSWVPTSVFTDGATYAAPLVVSNFKGTRTTTTSTFTWNLSWPMSGVTYEVYRSNDNSTFAKVNEQTSVTENVNFTFSEAVPPPGQTYYYYVKAAKSGYATHTSEVYSISSTPTITSTGSLGGFIQGVGTPSTSQSYVVSGVNLTNNIVIDAPAGYEISSNSGSTWSTSLSLAPTSGAVGNTSIYVRLNSGSAGTFSGNITHSSIGATSVTQAVTGTVQSSPLTVSNTLIAWPLTSGNTDNSAVRATGVSVTAPTLKNLVLSNGVTVPAVTDYSATHGMAYGPAATGLWTPTPGSSLNRAYYVQFTVTASATHSLRVDSLILANSCYNSANGKLAVVYSISGFTTDSANVSGASLNGTSLPGTANGGFSTPIAIPNQTAANSTVYRFALNGSTGITLASGQTLTVRIYNAVGSSSAGRYVKLKDVSFKGLATANPLNGEYRSHQTGDWTDLNTWERYDSGTSTWVTPVSAYPVYDNSNGTTIQNGHTITIASTLANGSGYIRLTKINNGGQLIVNNGASLNIANDGVSTTTDLQVDGTFTLLGGLFTNGNCTFKINGTFVNSGTNMNFSNTGDSVFVYSGGIYQHNVNSGTTPTNLNFKSGATFNVTGITTNQTGIFRSTVTYGDIIWDCQSQANYYAFRANLGSNVLGKFTVKSTGTTYITFLNGAGTVSFPGGFYQTGGTVNFRESGTFAGVLSTAGDFSVTGGSFKSNMGTGTSLTVNLTGTNKTLSYSESNGSNTNWNVSGSYTLGSNLSLPSAGFGLIVSGTLVAGSNTLSGSGDFTLASAAILSTSSASGINGNLANSGVKTLNAGANFIFNGSVAQQTGALLPSSVSSITINNTSNVNLSASTAVTGSVNFTNGMFLLGNNTLTTASVVGSSSSKYFVTDGTGALKINNVGVGSTVFPIGASINTYNPVTLNNSGTSDNFSVRVKGSLDNAPVDPDKIVNKQWTITEDVAGESNLAASFGWLIADQASGFSNSSAISVINYNGSWNETLASQSGGGTLVSPYLASVSGISNLGAFAIQNSSALPLSLVSFKAKPNTGLANSVQLTWVTANEVNTKSFVIERSNDGKSFAEIALVAARNQQGTNNYAFTDVNALPGTSYYRLRQLDLDDSFKLSKVESVEIGGEVSLSVYPIPASSSLSVVHPPAVAGSSIKVFNLSGVTVLSQTVANGSVLTSDINISGLAGGYYIIQFNNGTTNKALRFVKQ